MLYKLENLTDYTKKLKNETGGDCEEHNYDSQRCGTHSQGSDRQVGV